MSEIIERFTAKNYGCLKDVTVALTPLHAFIGPNDSGKSTILRGIRTAVQFAGDNFVLDEEGQPQPFDPGIDWLPLPDREGFLEVRSNEVIYRIRPAGSVAPSEEVIRAHDVDEEIVVSGISRAAKRRQTRTRSQAAAFDDYSTLRVDPTNKVLERACRFFMRGARLLRLDADALRAPSRLLTANRVDFEDEHGQGLAGVYDVILSQHLNGFLAIQEDLQRLFPSVKSLGLKNTSDSTKEIRIQLTTGDWIPTRFMSEGMLYYLAFAAIRYLAPKAVLLIEEPENGLHPARIVEVMQVLREISKTTQVLLATHSPLVINEMQPEEVSVVTRNPETGTKVTPMKETANFEKRSSVYALGELWLSFADGKEEAPLIEGRKASWLGEATATFVHRS